MFSLRLALFIVLISVESFAGPVPVMARNSVLMQTCFTPAPDPTKALAACRALARNRKLSSTQQAKVFYFMGHWRLQQGQNALAIPDYTRALALNPSYADAYAERGAAYGRQGNYALALPDFTRYLHLRPKDVEIYQKRAFVYGALGNDNLAQADFATALRLAPRNYNVYVLRAFVELGEGKNAAAIRDASTATAIDPREGPSYEAEGIAYFNEGRFALAASALATTIRFEAGAQPYPVLWLHLARGRLSVDDRQEFAKNRTPLSRKRWPAPVVALYSGSVRPAAVFAAATTSDQRCEAHFYVGEWDLLQNKRTAARVNIAAAAKTCSRADFEYAGARAELGRLQKMR